MPELPEVETVARQLAPLLAGRRIVRVEIQDPLLKRHVKRPGQLEGRRIRDVWRLGKEIAIDLSTPSTSYWLLVHLRMTGRLLLLRGHQIRRQPPRLTRHLRARLRLDRGELRFVDPRRFGILRVVTDPAILASIGLDPMSRQFTISALTRLLHRSRQPLKTWLLRQDKLVGIGNIYACEIPFVARLSPFRRVHTLKPADIRRLHAATKRVLTAAIAHCGTTFSDFQDAHGVTGQYQKFLAVYEREGQPCRRCGAVIQRKTQQQRSTYFCARCQV